MKNKNNLLEHSPEFKTLGGTEFIYDALRLNIKDDTLTIEFIELSDISPMKFMLSKRLSIYHLLDKIKILNCVTNALLNKYVAYVEMKDHSMLIINSNSDTETAIRTIMLFVYVPVIYIIHVDLLKYNIDIGRNTDSVFNVIDNAFGIMVVKPNILCYISEVEFPKANRNGLSLLSHIYKKCIKTPSDL